MVVQCPISVGELLDKLTILKIKQSRVKDSVKLRMIDHEEKTLSGILKSLDLQNINDYSSRLFSLNQKLWCIEDDIRHKESLSEFDDEFVQLARLVYKTNDQRFQVKKEINEFYGSHIQEVKSYEN